MKSLIAARLAVLCVACALSPGFAQAQDLQIGFIGIFADPQAGRCNIPAPIGTISTFYVLAVGSPGPADFSGAEFRIEGFPSAWVPTVTPSPLAAISVGNPLQEGCNIAFDSCQQAGVVLLYTVRFEVWSQLYDVPLSIASRVPCLHFPCCPIWTVCDEFYTHVCLTGGEVAILNGSADPCATAVEPASWSRLKALYR